MFRTRCVVVGYALALGAGTVERTCVCDAKTNFGLFTVDRDIVATVRFEKEQP